MTVGMGLDAQTEEKCTGEMGLDIVEIMDIKAQDNKADSTFYNPDYHEENVSSGRSDSVIRVKLDE